MVVAWRAALPNLRGGIFKLLKKQGTGKKKGTLRWILHCVQNDGIVVDNPPRSFPRDSSTMLGMTDGDKGTT